MSDREYIKFNTSVQVASNSSGLIKDDEGNIAASLELRLPDNIFPATNGNKKVDSVQMLTTKMRISMENTPIAQIPLETSLMTNDFVPSTCQLGVYPYCLLDNHQFKPENISESAFPHYYDNSFTVRINTKLEGGEIQSGDISFRCNYDGNDMTDSQKNVKLLLKECGLWDKYCVHYMNLCAQSNHEPFKIEADSLMVKHISTLEQMLQDALENAITLASSAINTAPLEVFFLQAGAEPQEPNFVPDTSKTYTLNGISCYFCSYIVNGPETGAGECFLKAACKPIVKFTEQSMRIEYDTACFDSIIPFIWNPAYVETWDKPEQITKDIAREVYMTKPPLKRVCRYGLNYDSSTGSYNYTLSTLNRTRAMNIVANDAMYKTFSFLPWIKVTPTSTTPDTQLEQAHQDPFYILDGTGATVTMSQPEPIMPDGGFLVTDNTRYWYNETGEERDMVSGSNENSAPTPWINYYGRSDRTIRPTTLTNWMGSLVNAGLITANQANIVLQLPGASRTEEKYILGYARYDMATDAFTNGRLFLDSSNLDLIEVSPDTRAKQPFQIGDTRTLTPQEDVTRRTETYTYTSYDPNAPSQEGTVTSDLPDTVWTTYRNDGVIEGEADGVWWWFRGKQNSEYTWTGNDVPQDSDFEWVQSFNPPFGADQTIYSKFPYRLPEYNTSPEGMNGNAEFPDDENDPTYYDCWYWMEVRAVRPNLDVGTPGYFPGTPFLATPQLCYCFSIIWGESIENRLFLYKDIRTTKYDDEKKTVVTTVAIPSGDDDIYAGNVHLTFEWDNLPIVVLSPIQSVVLTLQGMTVTQEIQPINIAQPGGSSLVSSIPVIENYYSLAQTLRDLHDELVVIKDSYDDQATYSLNTVSGQERSLRISAHFITKDGRLHQIYIPPNGVYSLQLTFGVSFYFTS